MIGIISTPMISARIQSLGKILSLLGVLPRRFPSLNSFGKRYSTLVCLHVPLNKGLRIVNGTFRDKREDAQSFSLKSCGSSKMSSKRILELIQSSLIVTKILGRTAKVRIKVMVKTVSRVKPTRSTNLVWRISGMVIPVMMMMSH